MSNTFEEFIDTLDGIPGMEEFVGLAKTPDSIFDIMYPSVKAQVINTIHDPQTEALIQASRLTPEYQEIATQMPVLIAELDAMTDVNPNKIEFMKMIFSIFTDDFSDAEIFVEVIAKDSELRLPAYANLTDAGADIYMHKGLVIGPKTMGTIVPTGLKMAIPSGWQLSVRPRSGVSHKTQIRVSNAPGTIDCTYRGEIGIIVDNFGDEPFAVEIGDRLAQLVLERVYRAKFTETKDVSIIGEDRGGGYGHTGI